MKPVRPLYKVLYYFLYVCLAWAVKLLYPIKVYGKQDLKAAEAADGGACVLAPNHLRAIDPMYVLLARGLDKKMLIMGKEELFEINGLLNFIWKVFGAFPVDRGAGNRDILDSAIAEVKKGRGLLIFPEGTRSKDGNLGRLKSGAFVVAWQAGAAMVPCRIWYAAGKPKLFRRIYVAFGPAVSLEEMGLVGEYNVRAVRDAKRIFTARLEALYSQYKDGK